jgi:hypothetical protein
VTITADQQKEEQGLGQKSIKRKENDEEAQAGEQGASQAIVSQRRRGDALFAGGYWTGNGETSSSSREKTGKEAAMGQTRGC